MKTQKTLFLPVDEGIAGKKALVPFEILDQWVNAGVEQVVFRNNTHRWLATIEELQDADDVEIDDRWNKTISLSMLSVV